MMAMTAVRAQDTPPSTREKQDVLWSQMEDSVRFIAQHTDGVVGVAILDLTDQRSFFLHADAVYPTASTIKIAVLAELYRQHEAATNHSAPSAAAKDGATRNADSGAPGHARLDDPYIMDAKDAIPGSDILLGLTPGVTRLTNRDLATIMVAVSDNGATNLLIDRVGMENVNAWLAQAGLKETRLRRHMMDVKAAKEGRENTATPRELVTLLDAIYHGRILGKPMTDDFFKVLGTHAQNNFLPRLIPGDVVMATKEGDLDGVRNDAGVIFVPNRPFAIAVMTTFDKDEHDAEYAIARIGRAAWNYFDRVGKSSPLGRVVR